jgi:hypothetical protein
VKKGKKERDRVRKRGGEKEEYHEKIPSSKDYNSISNDTIE